MCEKNLNLENPMEDPAISIIPNPLESPEEYQSYIQKYTIFHLEKVEPKIKELVGTPTKKERRKLQEEIVRIIENAGYHHEALEMTAMFNL
jgi:hypothetical protein